MTCRPSPSALQICLAFGLQVSCLLAKDLALNTNAVDPSQVRIGSFEVAGRRLTSTSDTATDSTSDPGNESAITEEEHNRTTKFTLEDFINRELVKAGIANVTVVNVSAATVEIATTTTKPSGDGDEIVDIMGTLVFTVTDPDGLVANPDLHSAVERGIAEEAGVDASTVDVVLSVGCGLDVLPPPPMRRLRGSLPASVQGPRRLTEGCVTADYVVQVKMSQSAAVKARLLGETDLDTEMLADVNNDGVITEEEYNAFIENSGRLSLAESINQELLTAGITSAVTVDSIDAQIVERPQGNLADGDEVRTAGAAIIVIVIIVVLLVLFSGLFLFWRFRKSRPKEEDNNPIEELQEAPAPVQDNNADPVPAPDAVQIAPAPAQDKSSEPSAASGA